MDSLDTSALSTYLFATRPHAHAVHSTRLRASGRDSISLTQNGPHEDAQQNPSRSVLFIRPRRALYHTRMVLSLAESHLVSWRSVAVWLFFCYLLAAFAFFCSLLGVVGLRPPIYLYMCLQWSPCCISARVIVAYRKYPYKMQVKHDMKHDIRVEHARERNKRSILEGGVKLLLWGMTAWVRLSITRTRWCRLVHLSSRRECRLRQRSNRPAVVLDWVCASCRSRAPQSNPALLPLLAYAGGGRAFVQYSAPIPAVCPRRALWRPQ